MRFVVHEPSTNTRKVFSITGPEAIDNYSKIPTSIGAMKGDIIVFRDEGAPVRLPVGRDGQVLVADSTTETGLKWVTLE